MHTPPGRAAAAPTAPDAARRPRGRTGRRRPLAALAAAALAVPLLLGAAPPGHGAGARPGGPAADRFARQLVRHTGAAGALRHLEALDALARSADGTRAAGTRGHELSAAYAGTLLRAAGYQVTYQDFEITYRETLAEQLTVLDPERREVPVSVLTYTRSTPVGGLRAGLAAVPVDADGTSGCTAADYAAGAYTGRVALVRRGGCTFAEKQAAAADAGAVAALVYNNVDGALEGTLGDPSAARIPTGGLSRADGEALAARLAGGRPVTVSVELRELQEQRTTPNVIAETRGGDPDHVVMVGAHLDSVPEGPGINDDGSGSAGVLETALQYARLDHGRAVAPGAGGHSRYTVRFALWSAEELGLLGSEHYVARLSDAQRRKIALYLNFDMIASPNYGLFVYDGDDSDGVGSGPGPEGSAQLERGLRDFLAARGEQTRGTDFDGRSDYGPFIAAGIPSGGAFTGAEGVKTAAEQQVWGGTAGAAYDGCYHKACDGMRNLDVHALDLNVKAIADAVGHYSRDLGALDGGNGADDGSGAGGAGTRSGTPLPGPRA